MRVTTKRYLELLREISFFQFKIKDQSTVFGLLWSFLNPLAMLAVLYFIFRNRTGQGIAFYPIFILIGVIHYTNFATATGAAMSSLSKMRNLTCNVIFPKEILVIGSALPVFIEFVLSMAICVVIAYAAGVKFSWAILALPFIIILQLMMVLWISLLLSVLYVYARDIDHIYQVFLRMLFFATPVFYALSFAEKGIIRFLFLLNPLTHIMYFSRQSIIQGNILWVKAFFLLLLVNTVLLFVAVKVFRFYEPRFAEHI
jgi:ABC-type polysaccharide/polyol phosphate export permease